MNKTILVSMMCAFASAKAFAAPDFDASLKSFRQTLSDLVKADTTNPPGNEERAVKILASRLKAEKIPFEIVEFAPGRQDIVARLKGSGAAKPLLLLAHIDVVGVKDQNWSVPPHEVTEKDGFLYGRGVRDDLGSAVMNLETFIALKRERVPLKRDVIVAFTGDEESGGEGVKYLLKNRPELVDAGIVLNEGGSYSQNDEDKVTSVRLQPAEKIYSDFALIAKGDTGHSSVPKKNNSIYKLAAALDKLAKYKPEERLIPVTRAYFKGLAATEKPEMAKALLALANAKGKLPEKSLKVVRENPIVHVTMMTTCVATMLSGGTKVNALPPEARANVNCRILPDEKPEAVKARLEKIIGNPEIEVHREDNFSAAEASPVEGEIPDAVKEVSQEFYPGVPIVMSMLPGATDSRYFREKGIPAYGLTPFATRESDAARSHGIDERIPVAGLKTGLELWYKLVTKLAAESK